MSFWNKMLAVDRRWIFLLVGASLLVPILPFAVIDVKFSVSEESQNLFSALEKLPPGSKVLLAFDYDPPSAPELQPMADACVKYLFSRNLRVIIMGLWPQGPQQAQISVQRALDDSTIAAKNLQYGVDYVNLGFQSGNEFVIQRMGSDFGQAFPSDWRGKSYDSLELLRNVRNFSNVDFVVNFSAGYPGTVEWVQVAADRYNVRLGAGNTAVQAPLAYPYLRGGQLVGLLGGMRGAAEFEKLTGYRGNATQYMLSQTFAHFIVIFFIVIGNIAYFVTRGKKRVVRMR